MVSVGGFFASLKLVTDEASITKGIGLFEKIPGVFKNVLGGTIALAAAAVALGTETAASTAKLNAQASALGMSARTLDNWKGMVAIAGGDVEGFVGILQHMNMAFQKLTIGQVDSDFITNLGLMKTNFAALQKMSTDDKLRTILRASEMEKDPAKRNATLNQLGGDSLVQLYALEHAKFPSFSAGYADAASRNNKTDANYAAMDPADKANREIGLSIQREFELIGIDIEKAILPALKDLSGWFVTHKKDLADFASAIGALASFLFGITGQLAKSVMGSLARINNRNAFSDSKENTPLNLIYKEAFIFHQGPMEQEYIRAQGDLLKQAYPSALPKNTPDIVIQNLVSAIEKNAGTVAVGIASGQAKGITKNVGAEVRKQEIKVTVTAETPLSDTVAKIIASGLEKSGAYEWPGKR